MKIKYNSKTADKLEFIKYIVRNSPVRKKLIRKRQFLYGLIFLLLGMFGLFVLSDEKSGVYFVTFAVLWSVGYPSYYRWSCVRHAKNILKKNNELDKVENVEIVVSDSYLEIKGEHEETRYDINGFINIAETDSIAMFFVSSESALIISKHSITEGDIEAFMTEVRKRHQV